MRWIAALFWAALALSLAEMYRGNPTAINGVIGAGAGALITTVLAFIARR